MLDALQVTELTIYPIKGCAGVSVQSARITPLGLASEDGVLRDRIFVVFRPENGKFITQRQKPLLALVRVAVEPEVVISSDAEGVEDAALVLRAPDMPELRISLVHSPGKAAPVEVSVWDWRGTALDEGDAVADWFSKLLGTPARLARYAGDTGNAFPENFQSELEARATLREVTTEWAPSGHHIAFADGFPLLLASEASLADLNHNLSQGTLSIPMNRFRPNIVVDGVTAWDEDSWLELRLGENGAQLLVVKPCSRCKVPTIDQNSAVVGVEPMRTLCVQRSGSVLGWTNPSSFKASVFFGANACSVGADQALIRIGDRVLVTAWRRGPPIPTTPSATHQRSD